MAMRQVQEQVTFQFDPRKSVSFRASVPAGFLQHESRPQRIQVLWRDFIAAVNRQCKARQGWGNKHYQKTVFGAGMGNICRDFSRRTESIKVAFEMTHSEGRNKKYFLKVSKLSATPDSCRNVEFCLAEIPFNERHAFAEFVGFDGEDPATSDGEVIAAAHDREQNGMVISATTTATSDTSGVTVTAPIEPAAPNDPVTLLQDHDNANNYPLATVVAAPPHRSSSSLERMQELESIKMFLSESEFATKRQAILDSI